MEIWIEAVILDNFCMDVFLSYAAHLLTKTKTDKRRILTSALLGSVFALLSPLVKKFALIWKFSVLFLCTLPFYEKNRGIRGYAVFTFVYAFLTFAYAGVLSFLLLGKARFSFISVSDGYVVAAISLSLFFFLYAIRQIKGLISEKRREPPSCRVSLSVGDRTIDLSALFDSGNLLTDDTGCSVVLIDEKVLSGVTGLDSCGSMLVRTASGSKILPLVKIPSIKIYSETFENTMTNVTAALSDLPSAYPVILPYNE